MEFKRITNRMPVSYWEKILKLVYLEKRKPPGKRRFNSIQEYINQATEEKLEREPK